MALSRACSFTLEGSLVMKREDHFIDKDVDGSELFVGDVALINIKKILKETS